ncbi:hypothetical protein DCO58_06955 [Helicobacter saguini]|uniref:Uncharacterized protein n=1 Tax=Helicobacter saguini TaxID=1548018 RepID=A0A347VN27_9HELI|nr:hypothetical protein [Helicobacter saguini]MWV61928.1 hypothetical protein [Helicobacter saguini]MWV67397.1 hypothetical protein [Helicobacter saguini]MWV69750.1 hypothetical protein [Helicobacter saguini]MWV73033.1 hypothetical protein [Helicobacter saguini]TLD95591.1 hypothetical protein LS64_001680 [Helicobacter saguini]
MGFFSDLWDKAVEKVGDVVYYVGDKVITTMDKVGNTLEKAGDAVINFIFGKDEKKTAEVIKNKEYDPDNMDSRLEHQKLLDDLVNVNIHKAEKIESEMAADCQKAFCDLLDSIKKHSPHYTSQISYLQSIADSIPDTINGRVKSDIVQKLSLSNPECENILKMQAGEAKKEAILKYFYKVSKENILKLQSNVTYSFQSNTASIKERFNIDIGEKVKELQKANNELENMLGLDNLEKFKKQLDIATDVFKKAHYLMEINKV